MTIEQVLEKMQRESLMSLFKLWALAYRHPSRLVDELAAKPAPLLGFYGVLIRSLLDSLLIYLPLSLMRRIPPMPSFITFLPTESYFATEMFLAPFVFLVYWLFSGALLHVLLRGFRQNSNIDYILNLLGWTSLVIAAVILVWDWFWIVVGGVDQYFLGISHLVIDIWGITIVSIGLERILGVPFWMGVLLNIFLVMVWLPFGMIFMRSPV